MMMVLRQRRYAFIAILIAIAYYAFNVFVTNIKVLGTSLSIGFGNALQFYIILLGGYWETVPVSSFISTIILGVLVGTLFSLILFKTLALNSIDNMGALGSVGIFFGILAPGCAACGVGVFSLLGISAASLSFLPFGGFELSLAAIVILLYSLFKLSKNLTSCSA